jgi:hypothetical protein
MRSGATVDNLPADWQSAPLSGVVIYVGAAPSMKKGDNVAYIGKIAEDGK